MQNSISLKMNRTDFLQFRDEAQLELISTEREYICDDGNNLVYANVEYYKFPNISVPLKDIIGRKNCMEEDIDRLRINIKNLLKAIFQEKSAQEIERSVLKLNYPQNLIKNRLQKQGATEKEIEIQSTQIMRHVLEEELSKITQASQVPESYFITQILSTNEIRKGDYGELMTATMQLQQTFSQNEIENA